MPVIVATPASVFPVTLEEAKEHCRIEGNDEDANILDLIKAATAHVESYCGRSFTAQGLIAYFDSFNARIDLFRGPVSAVTSVSYFDGNNELQTLDVSQYEADLFSNPATLNRVSGLSWPDTYQRKNAVQVAYTTAGNAPHEVKLAIKLLVGQWNEQRAAADTRASYEIPFGVSALLSSNRDLLV